MKTTIFIIFLISTKIVCGQKDSVKIKRHNPNAPTLHELSEETKQRGIDNKLSVYIPLLPLIDPFSGFSLRLGSEFKIYRNVSMCLEAGGYFYSQPRASWFDNLSGYIAKTSLKYYFNKKKLTVGNYCLIDYVQKQQNYKDNDSINITNVATYERQYLVDKFVNGITFKYGYTYLFYKSIYLDIYVGAGVRVINRKTNLTEIEEANIKHKGDGGITPSLIKTKGTIPILNAGIKLGFRII
ncbi:MAG: hypothetical protein V4677_14540 [Bacteroidota bacterium]